MGCGLNDKGCPRVARQRNALTQPRRDVATFTMPKLNQHKRNATIQDPPALIEDDRARQGWGVTG